MAEENLPASPGSRQEVLELLRIHGWNATSFQILERDYLYWFGEGGCVGYFDTGSAWVAAGSPVAAPENLSRLALAFAAAARAARRRAVFFAVEERLISGLPFDAVIVGQQAWWDPLLWPRRRTRHRSIREQVRRARARGVTVSLVMGEEVGDESSPLRRQLAALNERWLASRAMPPMEFLVALDPFSFSAERRYFTARLDGALIGFLAAAPIYGRGGWFLENLIRDPAAPNGTAELLVDCCMLQLAGEGCRFATLGLVPLAGEDRWLRLVRKALSGFYNFEGLRAFKAKLRPDGWDPIFLAYPRGSSALIALYDTLDAFSRGRVFAFAARSVLRASPFTLRALAVLLVPWTVALAAAPSARWFPSPGVQIAWTLFDLLLVAGFAALARRWRRRLAAVLTAALAIDAVLSMFQAALFNIPRMRGPFDPLVIASALAAPLFGLAVLVGGIRRHRSERRKVR